MNKVGGYGRVLMAQGHVMTRSGGLISRGDLLIARHMDLREDSPKAASFSNNGWGSMLIHRRVLKTVVALSLSPSTFFLHFFWSSSNYETHGPESIILFLVGRKTKS